MGKHHLGEFEEIVLLAVAILTPEGYGLSILAEIENRLDRHVSIGSLQTVLIRLEKKGFLASRMGAATKMRGGKRKRFYELSPLGKSVLQKTREDRRNLWEAIPDFVFQQ